MRCIYKVCITDILNNIDILEETEKKKQQTTKKAETKFQQSEN